MGTPHQVGANALTSRTTTRPARVPARDTAPMIRGWKPPPRLEARLPRPARDTAPMSLSGTLCFQGMETRLSTVGVHGFEAASTQSRNIHLCPVSVFRTGTDSDSILAEPSDISAHNNRTLIDGQSYCFVSIHRSGQSVGPCGAL